MDGIISHNNEEDTVMLNPKKVENKKSSLKQKSLLRSITQLLDIYKEKTELLNKFLEREELNK